MATSRTCHPQQHIPGRDNGDRLLDEVEEPFAGKLPFFSDPPYPASFGGGRLSARSQADPTLHSGFGASRLPRCRRRVIIVTDTRATSGPMIMGVPAWERLSAGRQWPMPQCSRGNRTSKEILREHCLAGRKVATIRRAISDSDIRGREGKKHVLQC